MSDSPRVLWLGDSIRMSCQPHAARLLDRKAEVVVSWLGVQVES